MTPNDLNGAAEVSDELLPCPFCGGSAHYEFDDKQVSPYGHFHSCDRCATASGSSPSKSAAIAAWNRRALAAAGKQADAASAEQAGEAQSQIEHLDRQNHRYRVAMRRILMKLTDLLDEDQFNNLESIIQEVGLEPPDKSLVPSDVMRALDRMCTPLDKSVLSGATARADAHSMHVIRDYIIASTAPTDAKPADATPSDTERLDFMLNNDAFTVLCNRDGSIIQYQLMTQDEDENYEVLHNERRFYNTEREAIDAAIAAAQPANGDDRG